MINFKNFEKKTKFVLAIVALFVFTVLVLFRGQIFYGKTQQKYMNSCQTDVKEFFALSNVDLYRSCECTYKNYLSLFGKNKMKKFTNVLLENNKDKTIEFLNKNKVDIRVFDEAFKVCF